MEATTKRIDWAFWRRSGWHRAWPTLLVLWSLVAVKAPAATWVPEQTQPSVWVDSPTWLYGWVDGHMTVGYWLPAYDDTRWSDAHWEDRWVEATTSQQWIEGYWNSVWTDGSWNNQWVDGYWDWQWTDGYWEESWNDGYAENQWTDGYWDDDGNWNEGSWSTVWVDGYSTSNWVEGSWSANWVDDHWDSSWTEGSWNSEWVEGTWADIEVPAHMESVWVEGEWVTVTVPAQYVEPYWVDGYWGWTLSPGYWSQPIVVPAHWEGPWLWSDFDEPTGDWFDYTSWTPDAGTVPAPQSFTQTRTASRNRRMGQRNEAGDERNVATYAEPGSFTRIETGTGGATPGGGGGAPISVPSITSSPSSVATVGLAFGYQVAANPAAAEVAVTGLPAWLTFDSSTRVLRGVPTAPGTYVLVLTASNALGASAPFTLTVTVGSFPPPTQFRHTEVGSNHVALTWNAPGGGLGVDYYELSNGAGPLVFAEADATSFLWAGLSPLTTYAFQLRAVDCAGNRSAWVALAGVRTSPAGTPSGSSKWVDLARTDHAGGSNYVTTPPDGVRDEVIGVDQDRFAASVLQSSWSFSFNNFWTLWGITWPDGAFTPNFTFALMLQPDWDYSAPLTSVDLELSFVSEPNQTYAILADDSEGHVFQPQNAVQHSLPASFPNLERQHIYTSVALDRLQFAKFYLVRYAAPIGSVSIPGSSSRVPVGAARGGGGVLALPLPSTGNVVLSIKDAVGALLKAGSTVAWEVWDGVGKIRVGSSTVGDLLDVGISTSGQFQVGLKLDDSATVWITVDVQPPGPALKSRDRYLSGTIDTASELYRTNQLEFINTSTGESLGTYRLDGNSSTHLYATESEILSDAELDGVLTGSLTSLSAQLNQPVVFWRQSPGSSAIRFAAVFSGLGAIEIRVRHSSGTIQHTVRHTLTSEPNFGGLLSHLDSRIKSLEMPAVAPWSLLPPLSGIDDEDDSYVAASRVPARAQAIATAPDLRPPPKARTGWQTNFLVKAATAADRALDASASTAELNLKMSGGYIKGYVDGLWDGFKSDVMGIVEVAQMGAEGLIGDFDRAKAIWDGIRQLAALDAAGRSALFDSLLDKFVHRATIAVPWTPAGSDADEWGAAAYMSGYTGGFVTEQAVAIFAGGGLVSKIGQATKVALSGTRLGQVTGSMVSNARRFTTGAFLAAARPVSTYGTGALRAMRKAIDDLAKVVIDQTTTVGNEFAAVMERLGVNRITYQKVADDLGSACKSEAEWLRVGISGNAHIATLSAKLGGHLTESGMRGFLNLWKGALRDGAGGDFMHHLYNVCTKGGSLDKQALARVLEMFDAATSSGFRFTPDAHDLTKWISPAGWVYELGGWEGHRLLHNLAHGVSNYVPFGKIQKPRHSVFAGLQHEIYGLIDEAWNRPRIHGLLKDGMASDELVWICEMGRVIGTNGETKVRIVVETAGSRIITTAYPVFK
ncbi:putative Ig domain-containing protein [Horticoccus sp. 23ND18S-11]|uniref:putative Ig domain-containing protein n=1 Tax=Horticoccus sp. 23ND18S-11 TaxID=3391832 RepID=UPI0039C9DDBD